MRTLIVGAGITGLATAAALSEKKDDDYIVLESDSEVGGWCKTVKRDGFVWDYSGHFFHFKHPEIERWLRDRMPGAVRVVEKKSFIAYGGRKIDFPFQKNIHQLPQRDFIDCLHDLYFARSSDVKRDQAPERNFEEMLYARFGKSICEKFLVPYNEKLYACSLATLDKDAMGRFFPHADLTDVVRNMKRPDNASYNATFTYPEGGAIEYVRALESAVSPRAISLGEGDVYKRQGATSSASTRPCAPASCRTMPRSSAARERARRTSASSKNAKLRLRETSLGTSVIATTSASRSTTPRIYSSGSSSTSGTGGAWTTPACCRRSAWRLVRSAVTSSSRSPSMMRSSLARVRRMR